MLFQPLFGGIGMGRVAVDRCPKARAVVGMGKVAEFVDAHIINHEIGRADQTPVQADAGALPAYTPKGFGVAQGGGGGEELQGVGVLLQARQQGFGGAFGEKAAQMRFLLRPRLLRQQKVRRLVADVVLRVGAELVGLAAIPNVFGCGVRRGRGRCVPQGAQNECFVVLQPQTQLPFAQKRRNVDADSGCRQRAQNDVFLGAAFQMERDVEAV